MPDSDAHAPIGRIPPTISLSVLSDHRFPRRVVQRTILFPWLLFAFLLPAGGCNEPAVGDHVYGTRLSSAADTALTDTAFARLIAELSETGGFFDSDNLVSNEPSYLHVLGKMQELGVRGGAYLGVGPDQNFSYVAQVRPVIAFMIDIRRDNLLLHLLFKTLFQLAETRVEYMSLLFARPLPPQGGNWTEWDIEALTAYVDGTTASPERVAEVSNAVLGPVVGLGVPLSPEDLETIERFHGEFIQNGLDLRFASLGRSARNFYPTYRHLLLETDLTGRRANYLAREDDFRFLRFMQQRNLIIPVVGDLSGDHALRAIGRLVRQWGLTVSALYLSNVEDYLTRDGSFSRFAETVAGLPRDRRTVLIRSCFGACSGRHPESHPGYRSTQLLQTVDAFVDGYRQGEYSSYWRLVSRNYVPLR